MNTAGSGVGSPVSRVAGMQMDDRRPRLRRLDAELWAICSGVIGSASDMLGVWMAPVMAQLMMTLLDTLLDMDGFPVMALPRSCTGTAAGRRPGRRDRGCLLWCTRVSA